MSLSELDISDVDALVYFDTAPRRRKRIIAMLGLIYRCATGRSLTQIFPKNNTYSSLYFEQRYLDIMTSQ